jgi:hypothetical protein
MSSPGSFGRKGGGTSSSSAIMSGSNPTTNFTEYWDGTSWTEVAEMATARSKELVEELQLQLFMLVVRHTRN